MKRLTTNKVGILLVMAIVLLCGKQAKAVDLWVGESYTWDFSGAVMGSTYNMSVSSSGGYLSITGSGFYRTIKPTQYFSGTATVTAEWDYSLYYGDTKRHQRVTLQVSCKENPVSIHPTSVSLSPGETRQLGYRHAHDNEYVGEAQVYFSGGNSSFSVTSDGFITAIEPGSGYVNVYSKLSNAANAPVCLVTVKDVEPTGASINNVNISADKSTTLKVNVSPSNATVKSTVWSVKSGSDIVRISGSELTALKPGQATIYCTVNGTIRSNDAAVNVFEPPLKCQSTLPENGSAGISVFAVPTVKYSHSISKGNSFGSISLKEGGNKVAGEVEISDREVRFIPSKPFKPVTNYQLSVPRGAVVNKWGGSAESDVSLGFTTGRLEQITLNISPASGAYLTKSDRIRIESKPADAKIYYTTDGSSPTAQSKFYTAPIAPDGDITVKAMAVREGYDDSEVVSAQFFKSQSEIVDYFPNDNSPMFNYALASPHLILSGNVVKSNNFRRISLTDKDGAEVPGQAFVTLFMVTFVPDEPLEGASSYTLDIPRDAVKTDNGEVFRGFKWTFTTPIKPVGIAMRGDETLYMLSDDGSLRMQGMEYLTTKPAEGSFTFKDHGTFDKLWSNVDGVAAGYTHLLTRKEAKVSGSGLALCGETGGSSGKTMAGNSCIIKAGFQTSAIIDEANSLWMCGRNDFYQLGDSIGSTVGDYIKVADNVIDVALGNGFTLFVDKDNVMWAVGRNHLGQLGDGTKLNRRTPVKIMEGVEAVFASSSGFFSACITTSGDLMTWGDNSCGQLGRDGDLLRPAKALANVTAASLGESHSTAIDSEFNLYAWGSNSYGQVAPSGGSLAKPSRLAQNVMAVSTGPFTTLVLRNSGKLSGWGRITHKNFGANEGKANDFIVYPGLSYDRLNDVKFVISRLEVKPDTKFALAAYPVPVNADYDLIEWSSDRPDVASVEGNGIISTSAKGEALITVKLTDRYGVAKSARSIIVVTDNPNNSGIVDINALGDDWTASMINNNISIENATIGATFSVYNAQGILVASKVATDNHVTFEVNRAGVYIVTSCGQSVKLLYRQ